MMTKSGPWNRKELCLQREFSAVDTAKWAPESWHNFRNWAMKQGDVSVTERRKPRGAGSEVCLEPEVVTLQLRAGWGALDLQFHRVESLHLWLCWSVQFSSVQSLSRVRLFVTPWIAACQASLSITNSRSSLRLTSIESVMPSSHLVLCHPLLLLPSIPPSLRVFSNESTLRMRWPKYWSFSALASFLPKKSQGWSVIKNNTTYWEVYSLGIILITSGTFSHWLFMTSLNVNQYYPHLEEQNLGNCHQNSWRSMGPFFSVYLETVCSMANNMGSEAWNMVPSPHYSSLCDLFCYLCTPQFPHL